MLDKVKSGVDRRMAAAFDLRVVHVSCAAGHDSLWPFTGVWHLRAVVLVLTLRSQRCVAVFHAQKTMGS